jgi:hypothetical protein
MGKTTAWKDVRNNTMEGGDQSMEGWVGQQYGRISRPGEKLKCPVEIYLGASVSYGQYWTLHYPAHATMQARL